MTTQELAEIVRGIAVGASVVVQGDNINVMYHVNAVRNAKQNWTHTFQIAKAIRAALPESTVAVKKPSRYVHSYGGCSGYETRDSFYVMLKK